MITKYKDILAVLSQTIEKESGIFLKNFDDIRSQSNSSLILCGTFLFTEDYKRADVLL